MVQIACGCAAHTVFVLTVAPQMFRCRGGSLSRAHSVGRPPCTPWQCVTTRELFFWMDVIFLQVALGSLPLMLPLRDTSFCGLTHDTPVHPRHPSSPTTPQFTHDTPVHPRHPSSPTTSQFTHDTPVHPRHPSSPTTPQLTHDTPVHPRHPSSPS